jgi:hypothetical protein
VRLNAVTRGFLERQAESGEAPVAAAVKALLAAPAGPKREKAATALARLAPEFGAMLRDTEAIFS